MAEIAKEKMLVEAMKNILENNAVGSISESSESHNMQFRWEDINRDFALKVKDSDYFESLTAAFYKVHSYTWLSNMDKFTQSIEPELNSHGVPYEEIMKAIEYIHELHDEYLSEKGNEAAYGWPDDIEGIRKTQEQGDIKEYDEGCCEEVDDDRTKETMSGENEPIQGAEPDNVRPIKNKA